MSDAVHRHAADAEAFTTLDGSTIREFMHPSATAAREQSLAEASVPPGARTVLHRHHRSEELYHVLDGCGRMTLGDRIFDVEPGDTVAIVPGTPHCIENIGERSLVFLCCCAPAYGDEDTELLE